VALKTPDNLLAPISSKMFMSYFLHFKRHQVFLEENIPGFFSI